MFVDSTASYSAGPKESKKACRMACLKKLVCLVYWKRRGMASCSAGQMGLKKVDRWAQQIPSERRSKRLEPKRRRIAPRTRAKHEETSSW